MKHDEHCERGKPMYGVTGPLREECNCASRAFWAQATTEERKAWNDSKKVYDV